MESVVEVKNLTKKFGDFTAVDNISFTVNRGEIFGFLGPNGAGKSTTIRMLCGILMPGSGEGSVAGYDIISEQDDIKNVIGYMSQKFSLYDDLTVSENLEFFGSVYGLEGSRLKDEMKKIYELAEIGTKKNELVKNLPGGIKQRLALGSAIIHDPPILFLDEPTSGVDPIMRRNFWDIIYRFSDEGKTIFITTHYMDEAEHCDRIALIISGEIIALDSPGNLKKSLNYDVYSLETENFLDVFQIIKSLDFIDESAIFGSDIHILCRKDIELKKQISNILKQKKTGKFSIKRVSPSLEDVFVTSARRYGI